MPRLNRALRRARARLFALSAIALLGDLLIVIIISLLALSSTDHPASTRAANSTPPPGCNPAPGTGKLGSCAPHATKPAAASLTGARSRSAGWTSPHFIGSRPIGVDVSSYQGCSIDWSKVPVKFAFFKATEGTGYTDRCLAHNVWSAKRAKLPYGVYDFLRPGRSSAIAEADHFVAAVRAAGANTSLPPVADVEANAGLSPATVGRYVCTWHARVRALLGRKRTITYTGAWFWNPQVAGGNCGSLLWASAYTAYPIIPRSWAKHTIWQYSDGVYGPSPHINRWDTDVFNGTFEQLRALAGEKAKPISAHTKQVCRKYAWYGPPGRKSRARHGKQSRFRHGQRRRYLVRNHIACSQAGVATRR